MKKPNCNCSLSFKDLMFFDRLITPSVLTLLYWISIVLILLGGLFSIFATIVVGSFSFLSFILSILGIVISCIFTRIGFELICVAFNINKNLEKLVQLQSGENTELQTCCSKTESTVVESSDLNNDKEKPE